MTLEQSTLVNRQIENFHFVTEIKFRIVTGENR